MQLAQFKDFFILGTSLVFEIVFRVVFFGFVVVLVTDFVTDFFVGFLDFFVLLLASLNEFCIYELNYFFKD